MRTRMPTPASKMALRRLALLVCTLPTLMWAQIASAGTMVLSYAAGASGLGQTELVELMPDGPVVRAKLPGLVAAVRGKPVWIKPRTVKVRTVDCECVTGREDADSYDEAKPPAACTKVRNYNVLALHDGVTGKALPLGKTPKLLSDGEGEASWSIEVLGQIGTLLIAEEKRWNFSCGGAHGSHSSELLAIDLATGKPVSPWTPAERTAILEAGRTKAIAAIKAAAEGEEFESDTEQSLAVVALVPRWNGAGTLLPRYLMQVDWNYAGGDGVWGSYSRSAWLQLAVVPAALKAGATLPKGLLAHWTRKGAPAAEFYGWSYVDEIASGAVLKLFAVKAGGSDASADLKAAPAADDAPARGSAAKPVDPARPQRPSR